MDLDNATKDDLQSIADTLSEALRELREIEERGTVTSSYHAANAVSHITGLRCDIERMLLSNAEKGVA